MSRKKKRSRNRQSKIAFSSKKPLLELLEEKQLLDAGGFSEIVQSTSLANDPIELEISEQVDTSALNTVISDAVSNAAESSQIVFVDTGVEEYESMLSDFPNGAEVILLDADRDGVQQISDALASRSDISAIHIISHGDEGEVHLGNTTLTSANLGEYSDQLAGWSNALTEDADLLFYGCDLAGNADGENFIESISAVTGADVAASDDLTGAADLGGDWDLEVNVGSVEAQSLEALAFSGLLASQNEVLVNVLYDGTEFDTDPLDDGSGNGVHTPGLDGGPNNNVIKTYDTFAVRIDWNVNEDDATGVTLTAELPAFASWAPDPTGMFAGCDAATSSFPDSQTLVCSLTDQHEGSNGVIRAIATLDQPLDETEFNVTTTLTTDDDPDGVVDELDQPLVASEAPIGNWLKGEPEVAEPEVSQPVTVAGEEGYVLLYPLSLIDFSQGATPTLGAGPINSALPIDFYDHGYQLVNSATVATADQMTAAGFGGRASCGAYDGVGAFPITAGTWTCGPATNPNGYPVVPINVVGHDASAAPALNADGSPNVFGSGVNALTGQIAFWLPADEVAAEIADPDNDSMTSARFENAIAQEDDSLIITSQDDVGPILVPGTAGYFPEISTTNAPGDPPANNAISSVIGAAPPPASSPGSTIGHDIKFHPGPLQVLETFRYDTDVPRHNIDLRPTTQGGLFNLPGAGLFVANSNGDSIGETPRGNTLTIQSQVLTASTAPTSLWDAPIHGCTAFDTTHYYLTEFGNIPVTVVDGVNGNTPAVTGGYSTTSNTGPLAHVYTGSANSMWNGSRGQLNAVGGEKEGLPYVVEFTNAPLATVGTSFGAVDDGLTCGASDAGTLGWVDATGDLSMFDMDGDGLYEGITRARVRVTENFPWAPGDLPNTNFTGFQAFFQVEVKADLAVQTVNQELFAVQSHSYGELDPVTEVPDLVPYEGQAPEGDCQPYVVSQWEANGNNDDTATGWCNNDFVDDGANSLDTSDLVDWDNSSSTRSTTAAATGITTFFNSSGAVVSIVEAALRMDKSNNDGLGDIKNNGDLVEFTLSPQVVGSSQEALTNVRLSDNLPANYHFVQFLQLPSTPGATCNAPATPDGTITCQFSEPNPAVDTGLLPAGLAGGWSDEVVIQVEVVGAVADPDSPTVITNAATVNSSGLGPWDPATESFIGDVGNATKSATGRANSLLPLPADEGAIVKAVDTHEGACELHPSIDPPPGDWGDNCSMIDYEGDMTFTLSLTNEGNTAFTNIRFVDVLPHNGDSAIENGANTSITDTLGGSPQTHGDGRTPPSDFAGTLAFVSQTGADTVLVSADDPLTISRDPDRAELETVWCSGVGGTVVHAGDAIGAQACPATAEDVTATFSVTNGPLNPGDTLTQTLTLDTEDHECDDIYTNTFGAQTDQIFLPIRSNDVSIMVNCEHDLALEKTIDPAFVPGPDWVTPGSTTIDFLIEITNQGDPVEDFDITDYVDTSVFTFAPANNTTTTTGGTANGGAGLPFTWDTTNPAAPVALVDGFLDNAETVTIPVTLTIDNANGPLDNWAEISRFDSDGDPSNGDSDPTNPNNPSTGPLTDEDSTPDDDQTDDNQPTGPGAPGDGTIDEDGLNGGDEDDHDVAGFPVYDLELTKTTSSPSLDFSVSPPTVSFQLTVENQGTADAFLVDVTEYAPPGLTYDAAATAAAWAAAGLTGVTDAAPTFTIAGPIAPGASVSIPAVYEMTDLTLAPFVNAAEISSFDSDSDPANPADPFAIDVDSTPDDTNDEPTAGDEDDYDTQVVAPYDLALTKTIESAVTPLSPNGSVTMLLTIENQGAPVSTVDITDYIDATMWQPFDPTLNVDGAAHANSTVAAGYSFTWDNSDPLNPVASLAPDTATDTFVFGETVVIPITLQPVDNFATVAPLSNVAEISNFDNDNDPTNGDASDGTISDLDSNPDDENGNGPGEDPAVDMVDDETLEDGLTGGDEDDHDGVLIPVYDLELIKTLGSPTYDFSLTPPTVTFDITVSNQGTADAYFVDVTDYGAPGLTYVSATSTATFTDANPTFTLDGPIAPGASETITVVYEMDLLQAPFENAAEISSFDSDSDPNNAPDPFAFDVDSTPDDTNSDDVIDHDTQNNDPDGDGNLNEETPGDEDDHDIEVAAPYDLSLVKTIESVNTPLSPDGSVVMFLTIENQAAPVSTVDITDYVDATMWKPFDPALNPGGAADASSTAAAGFSFTWDSTDPFNPVASVTPDVSTDQFVFGETIVIPITLQPVDNFGDVAPLLNVAEISNFDNDTDPTNGDASDGTISDLDSIPDDENGNGPGEDPDADMVNNETGEDGTAGGDEDDHDGALFPVYDVELIKTVRSPLVDTALTPWETTFDITVSNQGTSDVFFVDVTEYAPPGLTYDAAATAALWSTEAVTDVTDASPTFTIEGPIAPGASATFPLVFDVTDISQAPFVNAAEVSAFDDDDDPNNPANPLAVDVDSNTDAINDDDVIDHDMQNNDPDGDGDLNEPIAGDEDDHDIEVVAPYDLTLTKTIGSVNTPLSPNGSVTMLLTVENEAAAVSTVDITDYIDATMWQPFDTALNPGGAIDATSTAAAGFSYTWDATDPLNPVAQITPDVGTDQLQFGETVVIEITLQPVADLTGISPLSNVAEISNFDNDTDPTNGDASDGTISDLDSNPDGYDSNDPAEDDQDGVELPIYDLELVKTLGTPSFDFTASPPTVSYELTVTNQATTDVYFVDITEYPPAGVTYDPAATAAAWTAAGLTGVVDANPVFTIESLAGGASLSIPVVYEMTDLSQAPFENAAEISAFDSDSDPNNAPDPFAVDIDSTPDDTNDDDLIDQTDPNYDPDADGNLHEETPGDEDDHDIAIAAPYDLSLTKTIGTVNAPLSPDGSVTMLLTIENQAAPVSTVDITDYIDATMWQPFDPALNPGGAIDATSTAAAGFSYTWDATDPLNPVAQITPDVGTDQLQFGETVVIEITLQPVANFGDVAPLSNLAEISNFDNDTDPTNGDASDGTIADIDSNPDGDNGNGPGEGVDMVDDETGEDGTAGGDEDDHDGVVIPIYDLELIKTAGTPTFDYSATPPTVSYDITVSNQGTEDAYLVDVTDYGAPGLTYVSATSTAAGFTDANPTFTIDGPIAPGASETITVVYEMDLSQAPFENAAEISAFDSDSDPNNAPDPFAVDVDSTPDDTNDDDVIDHNQQNNDPDGDGNLNESTPGDEDDHDVEVVTPYDLALTKTIESIDTPLLPNGSVTMLLTVTNQASPVATVDLTDYIDAAMWEPFIPSLNPDGAVDATSTAAAGYSFTWDNTDPLNPVATLAPDVATDQFSFGETLVVPITLRPAEGYGAVAPLSNVAEISNFDNDTDPTNGDASDGTIADEDSNTDGINGNGPGEAGDMVDDDIDSNGLNGGDEDNHDGISIPIYDLELVKVLRDPGLDTMASPWHATFDITVSNQGTDDVFLIDVTEYPPAGLALDAAATMALWASEGLTGLTETSGVFTIAGPIAPAGSATFPVVFDITDPAATPFENAAEISAFDSDSDPNNAPDPFAMDVDSNPDGTNDDDVIDQTDPNYDPDGDGDLNELTPGDEDDHDVAELTFEFDLALEKTIDPAWTPGPDFITEGSTTIDFLLEVTNQATQVEDFDVTEYIDTNVFTFAAADNPAGNTGGSASLPYTWDISDPAKPVVSVDGVLATGGSVTIPVTLMIEDSDGSIVNWAEISYFDSDGDPSNGDSDPTNPNNQSGPLLDVDSTPDDDQADDAQPAGPGVAGDGEIDGDGTGSDPINGDEDDHDVAGIPNYDLELVKTLRDPGLDISASPWHATFDITVSNQGDADVYLVDVTEYPPAGLTFDAAATTALWAAEGLTGVSENAGLFTIAGPIAPADSVIFPIVYDITDPNASPFENAAEISSFDSDNDPTNAPDPFAVDVDSTPDGTNDDDVIDQTDPNYDPDGDGDLSEVTPGDEDDHDVAEFLLPRISLEKEIVGAPVPAASGTLGNFDVVYEFVTENNGQLTLTNLALAEDLASQFGGAFVSVVGSPVVTASTATTPPTASTTYDGGADANLFGTAASQLEPGQTVTVQITVEIDPDSPTAIYDGITGDGNTDLENRAEVTATDPAGNPISDTSDDPTDATNDDGVRSDASDDDGEPDDPTALIIPSISVEKELIAGPLPSSVTPDNVEATFELTLINDGNDRLANLSLLEDLAAQWGGAFAGIIGTPTITDSTAADPPEINPGFDGGTTDSEIFDNSGLNTNLLEPGQYVTVQITVDVDAGSPTAIFTNGFLANSAEGGATALSGGGTLAELSDDPSDPTDDDIDGSGEPDDPTILAVGADVSGTVFSDANGNGVYDPGESGILGVEIILMGTDIAGNPVNISVFTDADGNYTFEDILPGDYTLTQVQPPQFIDGDDAAGSLGGNAGNDTISFSLAPGSDDGTDYDFGELGLRPEFISKASFLSSTPDDYWSNLDSTGSGTQGLWVPFEASTAGAVQAILIDAEAIDVDIFDENMNLLNPAQEGDAGGTWVVSEGQRYFARLRGEDANFDFDLAFGDDVNLPITLDMSDNVVIAAGTAGDDDIELILGAQTHLLSIAGYTFEFDATVIDTFHIGAADGNDTVRVIGTDLDDVGNVLDAKGTLTSDAYEVHTYSFDTVIFDGQGGDDYTQIYGSNGDDELQAIPQDSTLTTPTQVMQMLGFERVDSYGRHGNDYAAMYGTQGDDQYLTFDTFEVLQGENMKMRTIGWDRVDAFGRGGNDTAHVFDTAGDDHLYVFPAFSVMQSDHLYAVVKDFAHIEADMKNGGNDKVYFKQIATAEHVFANGNIATITGPDRSVWVWNHDELEIDVDADEDPSFDLGTTQFVIQS